ncbi:hypothetical protein [Aeromonas sobria]|uniref:hypothetical protein n=1 Tax=Aeromonas sobria TaxID=646 RepID=UPI003F32E8C0
MPVFHPLSDHPVFTPKRAARRTGSHSGIVITYLPPRYANKCVLAPLIACQGGITNAKYAANKGPMFTATSVFVFLKCSTNPPQEAGTFPEVIFEIAKQSPDVERITMGRFNAFLPVQPGMRHPGALDVQVCESIVSLRSLQARAAALIEEKA